MARLTEFMDGEVNIFDFTMNEEFSTRSEKSLILLSKA